MSTDLGDTLRAHLDPLDVPPGDLSAARAAGGRMRRRRRAAGAAAAVAAVAVVALVATGAGVVGLPGGTDGPGGGTAVDPAGSAVAPVGPLDFTDGLRAYASPGGGEIHLGGRVFTGEELSGLDTDAAATARGIVYYDDGRPVLLDAAGDSRALEPGATAGGSFAPTAKADSDGASVAYGAVLDGDPTVVVRDLATGEVTARLLVDAATRIDALDGGVVALRDEAGTSLWDTATGEVAPLSGPGTRVADLRGGVLLHDGPRPRGRAAAGYTLVEGPIGAQLTFDGAHVLSWSGTLRATAPGGQPLRLDRGPADRGYAFWTLDTDGSVLVAVPEGEDAAVYDCVVPSGACTTLDPVDSAGGDPVFIGSDM